jgi:hypothetical protein
MIGNCVEFQVQKNNTLRIVWVGDKDDEDEVAEMLNKYGACKTFRDMTEAYWTNGWFVGTADELSQMSESPVVAQDCTHEDDGSITLFGKVWYYNNYMITDWVQEILDNGQVDFQLWFESDEGVRFGDPYNR